MIIIKLLTSLIEMALTMAKGLLLKTDRTATIVDLHSYLDYDKYMDDYREYYLLDNMVLLQAEDNEDINITASLLKLERTDSTIEIGGNELVPVFGNVLLIKSYLQGDINVEALPNLIRESILELNKEKVS